MFSLRSLRSRVVRTVGTQSSRSNFSGVRSMLPAAGCTQVSRSASTQQNARATSLLSPFLGLAAAAGALAAPTAECDAPYKHADIRGQTVLITGATSGIGEACAWQFAHAGCKLVLIGRRRERLEKLKASIEAETRAKVHTVVLDVRDMDAISTLPVRLPSGFRAVDILVNNAGLALGATTVADNNMDDAGTVMQTNVMGVIAFCAAFVPGMKARGKGHIINMGSVAGHVAYKRGTVYNASKFAVEGFTTAARHDLVGTPIRVTHISPGAVRTEFSNVRFRGDDTIADKVYHDMVPLNGQDVAANVLFAATRPEHVQVAEMTIYPTNQSSPMSIARPGKSLGR